MESKDTKAPLVITYGGNVSEIKRFLSVYAANHADMIAPRFFLCVLNDKALSPDAISQSILTNTSKPLIEQCTKHLQEAKTQTPNSARDALIAKRNVVRPSTLNRGIWGAKIAAIATGLMVFPATWALNQRGLAKSAIKQATTQGYADHAPSTTQPSKEEYDKKLGELHKKELEYDTLIICGLLAAAASSLIITGSSVLVVLDWYNDASRAIEHRHLKNLGKKEDEFSSLISQMEYFEPLLQTALNAELQGQRKQL